MKKIRQILVSILAFSMVFNCVGCKNSDKKETNSEFVTIKGEYLVENGKSEYKIVIPEEAGNLIQVAASEFNLFFSEATGVNLPIVTEAGSNDKIISIGETACLDETDITYEYSELGRDGYKIITIDDDLYLIGGSEYGSLYAVYELLEYLVDYDFYAKDCYTVAQGVKEVPLYDFDVTDIPDIPLRMASDGVVTSDSSTMYRMRVRPYIENFIVVNGMWAHNSFAYVKDSPDANLKWYNTSKTQLCYTAHGDEDEYKKMLNASFETLKVALMNDTEKESVTFTMEDNYDTCTCESCNAIVEEYGAISATIILFLNDLNQIVRDWFTTEEGQEYARDLRIIFFAYHGYEEAPVTYNEETGIYEANNGIQLDEGVYCQLCPIETDYYRPLTAKENEQSYQNMRGWTDMAKGNLYLWYYSTNFSYYLVPFDYFDSMLENYQFAVESDAYYMFDQRQHDESGVLTGWSNLKSYLNYKLAWDVEEDVAELTDKFFDAYFGPASDKMREVFNELRVLTNYQKENKELGGSRSLNLHIVSEEYWPKDVLERWLDCFDEAEDMIDVLKEKNQKQYKLYRDHINGEKLSVLYLFVECYSYNTSEDVINAHKSEFKELGNYFGLTNLDEATSISELYSKWGVN